MLPKSLLFVLFTTTLVSCAPQINDAKGDEHRASAAANNGGNETEEYPVEVVKIEVFEIVERDECRNNSDCSPYSYCQEEVFSGRSCETNNEEEKDPIVCKGTDKAGNFYPIHEICRHAEMNITGTNETYTTARCFKELNYTCAMSYFMPCTPNFDKEGVEIKGQEEACPDNFKCEPYKYGQAHNATEVKLCQPIEPATKNPEQCKTDFDCGFSVHNSQWASCLDNVCFRLFEKKK